MMITAVHYKYNKINQGPEAGSHAGRVAGKRVASWQENSTFASTYDHTT